MLRSDLIERKDGPDRFAIRRLPDDEGGGYLTEFPDLPGCMSDGETIEEAITNGTDAMRGWIEAPKASDPRTDPPWHDQGGR